MTNSQAKKNVAIVLTEQERRDIATRRIKLNLSQAELGEAAGVTQHIVSYIETGRQPVRQSKVHLVLAALPKLEMGNVNAGSKTEDPRIPKSHRFNGYDALARFKALESDLNDEKLRRLEVAKAHDALADEVDRQTKRIEALEAWCEKLADEKKAMQDDITRLQRRITKLEDRAAAVEQRALNHWAKLCEHDRQLAACCERDQELQDQISKASSSRKSLFDRLLGAKE